MKANHYASSVCLLALVCLCLTNITLAQENPQNALADQRDRWITDTASDGLEWVDGPDSGIRFAVRGTDQQSIAHDCIHRSWDAGTQSFDLVWTVKIDQTPGTRLFHQGVCMGIASAPPGSMTDDDIAIFVAIHFDGISAEVSRGEPYAVRPNRAASAMQRLASVVSGGAIPVVGWSHEALGAIGTGHAIRMGIRRSSDGLLTFSAWCLQAGQTQGEPWWSADWLIPDDLADTEFNTLFVKRMLPFSNRTAPPGWEDRLLLGGSIINLNAALSPPEIDTIEWNPPVLEAGDTITLYGRNFSQEAAVSVGGAAAQTVHAEEEQLRLILPPLETDKWHHLTISNPDGSTATARVPYGRLIDAVSPRESAPAGGDTLTITGAGFDDTVAVLFEGVPAETIEVIDSATLRVLAPAGAGGLVSITARSGEALFAGSLPFGRVERPALWRGDLALDALRSKFNDTQFKTYRDAIGSAFDESLERPDVLSWACAYEGKETQVQALSEWFASLGAPPQPGNIDDRLLGARFLAMAFDAVSHQLDPAERTLMAQYLYDSLDAYLSYARERLWTLTNVSWTNARANTTGIILAVALWDVHPHAAEAVEHALRSLLHYANTSWTEHGGCVDGPSWGMQGLSDYLLAANVLANAIGDSTLLDQPNLSRAHRFFETILSGPDSVLVIRQTHQRLRGASVSAYLGTRFDNPLMLWLADHITSQNLDGADELAQALAYRGVQPAPQNCPPLPTLSVLPKLNWASMRSDGDLQPAMIVGIKGHDGPMPYHRQNSVGGFLLRAHGDDLLINPGWNAVAATNHNLPLIDGKGPDVTGGFIVDAWETEGQRAIVIDVTDAYLPWTDVSVRRHFLILGDSTLIILDDLVRTFGRSRARSQFQTFEPELKPETNEIIVRRENASMSIRLYGPDVEIGSQEHEHWHTAWAEYLTTTRPLVSVITVAETDGGVFPQTNVEFNDQEIVVTAGDQKAIFTRMRGRWALREPRPFGIKAARRRIMAARAEAPPVIDGNLDDPVWQRAQSFRGFNRPNTWGLTASYDTEIRFAWDDEYLYAAYRCFDDELDALITRAQSPMQLVYLCGDDRVGLFIDPGNWKTSHRFFERVVNAAGVVSGWQQGHMGHGEVHVATGREPENGAWTVEMAIPWATVLNNQWAELPAPRSGMQMGMNAMRYHRTGEYSAFSHGAMVMISLQRWGVLVLE